VSVYSGPSDSGTPATTLGNGTVVRIYCAAQGETVTNNSGQSSSLWDDTQYGYIPDIDIDTGGAQPVVAECT
jgi:uncharacterized protein YraI